MPSPLSFNLPFGSGRFGWRTFRVRSRQGLSRRWVRHAAAVQEHSPRGRIVLGAFGEGGPGTDGSVLGAASRPVPELGTLNLHTPVAAEDERQARPRFVPASPADGIAAIARVAAGVNASVENIGARRLHTVMERVLDEVSFGASDRSGETVTVDEPYVEARIGELARNTDLSRFIL